MSQSKRQLRLVFEPYGIWFGTLQRGEQREAEIVIRNVGDQLPLSYLHLEMDKEKEIDGLTISPDTNQFPMTVKVRIDTTTLRPLDYRTTVYVFANDQKFFFTVGFDIPQTQSVPHAFGSNHSSSIRWDELAVRIFKALPKPIRFVYSLFFSPPRSERDRDKWV